jgi:hypothetical protein
MAVAASEAQDTVGASEEDMVAAASAEEGMAVVAVGMDGETHSPLNNIDLINL